MIYRETLDANQEVFLTLLSGGLWEEETRLSKFENIDFSCIRQLAEEQAVVGLVTAGFDNIVDKSLPQEEILQFVGSALQIEQRNRAMNIFVAKLIEMLRSSDVYALLLKGQGIAQCYDRPLWRTPGDVDLFLSDVNYAKAEKFLTSMASNIDEEISYAKHKALTIDGWTVELHGSMRSGLWRRLDRELDKVQNAVFCEGKVRSWENGKTQVFLPAPDEDVVFVFSHILQHFYKEGIGFRQICDWCRLLWYYKDKIDRRLLSTRLKKMGVMTEWKAFSALTVEYLGMPAEAIPFYDSRFKVKGKRILEFLLETGNFGHNRDYNYQKKYPYAVYKAISVWKHIVDFRRYLVIFPCDAVKVTWNRMCLGVSVALKGKKHE